jgi:tetratricopeptide (TPR) repeat protein
MLMKSKGRTPPGSLAEATSASLGFQRVKSTYTIKEISQLFGLSPRYIERWTGNGTIAAISRDAEGEPLYDFQALTRFRRIRELRASGLTAAQIDAQLSGQLGLFDGGQGKLIQMPRTLSPFEQALVLHEMDDPGAWEQYHEAIREGDYVADAYCNLGILEYESGNIAKAADRFTLSLKSEPRHFESHFNLANLYLDAGDLKLARLHYEIAAEIEPSFSSLHFNLGLAHLREGDLEGALKCLRRALELTSEDQQQQVDELISKIEQVRQARR